MYINFNFWLTYWKRDVTLFLENNLFIYLYPFSFYSRGSSSIIPFVMKYAPLLNVERNTYLNMKLFVYSCLC